MRQQLGWSDLQGLKVGIWGLGVEGRANVEAAVRSGANVVVADANPAAETMGLSTTTDERVLLDCELVVKTPGIPPSHPFMAELDEAAVIVTGGHGLWMNEAQLDTVACIAGTKGKSTTVSIVAHLFDVLGIDGAVGGNFGMPPYADAAPNPKYWCLEVSSYQIVELSVRPKTVAFLSLAPDHVEWHGDKERYYRDKLSLATLPGGGVTLASSDKSDLQEWSHELGQSVSWVSADSRAEVVAHQLHLRGSHNVRNVAMAIAVVENLTDSSLTTEELVQGADRYLNPGESRMATVADIGGTEFVDDCLATNVMPTLAAVESFSPRPIALIVGGHSRGIDYHPLGEALADYNHPLHLVCLGLPDNGDKIRGIVTGYTLPDNVTTHLTSDFTEAIENAWEWSRRCHGVVLLSPAAPTRGHEIGGSASNRFQSYREKSAAFKAVARQLSADFAAT